MIYPMKHIAPLVNPYFSYVNHDGTSAASPIGDIDILTPHLERRFFAANVHFTVTSEEFLNNVSYEENNFNDTDTLHHISIRLVDYQIWFPVHEVLNAMGLDDKHVDNLPDERKTGGVVRSYNGQDRQAILVDMDGLRNLVELAGNPYSAAAFVNWLETNILPEVKYLIAELEQQYQSS